MRYRYEIFLCQNLSIIIQMIFIQDILCINQTLNLNNGNLVGSFRGIRFLAGSTIIVNSSFEQMWQSMQVINWDSFIMKYSTFKNNGQYYGKFVTDYYRNTYVTAAFGVLLSSNVVITNNIFTGFEPEGFIYIQQSSSVLMANNVLIIDITTLYYI